jgi:hypothetical protein
MVNKLPITQYQILNTIQIQQENWKQMKKKSSHIALLLVHSSMTPQSELTTSAVVRKSAQFVYL